MSRGAPATECSQGVRKLLPKKKKRKSIHIYFFHLSARDYEPTRSGDTVNENRKFSVCLLDGHQRGERTGGREIRMQREKATIGAKDRSGKVRGDSLSQHSVAHKRLALPMDMRTDGTAGRYTC